MALHNIGRKSAAAAAATIGLGALLVGCSRDASLSGAQFTGNVAGAPVAVSCEPNQRAVVRQVAVNGGLQAQVQCESVTSAFAPASAATGTMGGYGGASPVAYSQPIAYAQPAVYTVPLENTRLVRTAYPVTRTVAAPRRVAYQPARERVVVRQPARSVKKSAIIIGSSAGVGAGLGAAFGGKKGAGIGALVGGGGAALWDQITRHKQ
jgi:hypothetical protein